MKKTNENAFNRLSEDEVYFLLIRFMYIYLFTIFAIFLVLQISVQKQIKQTDELLAKNHETLKSERIPIEEEVKHYIRSLQTEEVMNVAEAPIVSTKQSQKVKKLISDYDFVDIEDVIASAVKVEFKTTAYCPCKKCCAKTDGITASGVKATAWHTVAAAKDYPFGTKIYIPELKDMPNGGWFVVEDRGGAIKENRLDVFFDTHEEAINYGVLNVTAYVYYPDEEN